jgi:uncharacterized protein (DUF1499 family)
MADRGGRERRARRAATITMVALTLVLLSALAVVLSGPAHRFGLLSARWAIVVFALAGLVSLATAVLAIVGFALALSSRAWRGVAGSLAALVLGLAAGWLPLALARTAAAVPVIHDITTDIDRPPQWVALQRDRAAAENGAAYGGAAVAALQKHAYPDIAPLLLPVPPERAFARVEAAARAMGWRVVSSAPAEGRLEASDTTPWFGFTDDVVVRVTATPNGSRVDVRSASRVGRSDLGVNARRIRVFLGRIRQGV